MKAIKEPKNPMDQLNPELGGKIVKLVANDMERARRAAEEKAKKAKKKRKKG